MRIIFRYSALVLVLSLLFACQGNKNKKTTVNKENIQVPYPEWVKTANIYEVNIRQYTPEGTFAAFQNHLPRLKEMGVEILWLMPVNPIGEKNRKGTLGSYYSIKDYKRLNPEFGSQEDFKTLVNTIHENGMHVIIDWVANHSSWDNHMLENHPEWYTTDSLGKIVAPVEDWSDVADFNYDNLELQGYMRSIMEFWVNEYDIDGFRCDVAGMVPTEFWEGVRADLNAIKPVFMLAEAEKPELISNAFDMDYAWDLHHIMNKIAKGETTVADLELHFTEPKQDYPDHAIKMNFTSNHDENSWNGTVYERMGESAKTFAVLSATLPGMPLVYSGQEAGLDKRLSFFEKDAIDWKEHEMTDLYKRLFEIKRNNEALFNGPFGGEVEFIKTNHPEDALVFVRTSGENTIIVMANLSQGEIELKLPEHDIVGSYESFFSGEEIKITEDYTTQLMAWEYRVGVLMN